MASSIAKFHAIGDEAFGGKVLSHGPEDVLEELADQNHALATADRINQFLHSVAAHAGLQLILKVFLAEKIQTVACDATQNGMQEPGGKGTASQISRRAQQPHRQHGSATHPALQEALAVPIEEAHATKRADLQ